MKPIWLFLGILVAGLFSGCAPFNKDVPETSAPPATSAPPSTTAPGATRRPS